MKVFDPAFRPCLKKRDRLTALPKQSNVYYDKYFDRENEEVEEPLLLNVLHNLTVGMPKLLHEALKPSVVD